MSAAITFQVARESTSSRLSQAICARPEEMASRPVGRPRVLAVGAAIAAHVEHEHVEQRPVGDLAIDAARLGRDPPSACIRATRGCARASSSSAFFSVYVCAVLGARERLLAATSCW